MKEVRPISNLERLQNDVRVLEKTNFNQEKILDTKNGELLQLVPERSRVEILVRLYFEHFEKTYRIIHKPTFWKQYDDFWRSPQSVPSGFIAVLLLVMAVVRCMIPEEKFTYSALGSSGHLEAVTWIHACEIWLDKQSQKHRTLETYQIMCLQIMASSASCYKTKRAYQNAENLVTYFRSAGMHRDPSLLDQRTTSFEREMRRRLWATVAEMELQASLDRGSASTLAAVFMDCKPPLNLNDEDISPDALDPPSEKQLHVYTPSSYQIIAARSLHLRISLCSIINDPSSQLQHEDVLQYEQQIIDTLNDIPKWTETESQNASILLNLQLRQFYIMLHSPFARQDQSMKSRYSRMICLETSKYILDQHSKLISAGNFSMVLLREDIFTAALSICHNAYLCSLDPCQCPSISYPLSNSS